MKKSFCSLVLVVVLFTFSQVPQARALTFGDAALTVSVSTVSGAILGLSTLPFYEDSGKHTKNIFYGAAVGAVAGVLISAYSAVKEGSIEDEEQSKRDWQKRAPNLAQRRLIPEKNSALLGIQNQQRDHVVVWSPLASLDF